MSGDGRCNTGECIIAGCISTWPTVRRCAVTLLCCATHCIPMAAVVCLSPANNRSDQARSAPPATLPAPLTHCDTDAPLPPPPTRRVAFHSTATMQPLLQPQPHARPAVHTPFPHTQRRNTLRPSTSLAWVSGAARSPQRRRRRSQRPPTPTAAASTHTHSPCLRLHLMVEHRA